MRRLILLFATFYISIFPVAVISVPDTLKCETSVGVEAADLFIDYENKLIFWGDALSKYEIVGLTEEYITAYKILTNSSGKDMPLDSVIGGEVFVLDRATGSYIRSSVKKVWYVGEKPEDAKLREHVYQGKCL